MDENMKTLIVEDDFTSRFLLQNFLAPYGECHAAVNGREALDALMGSLFFEVNTQHDVLDRNGKAKNARRFSFHSGS